MNFITAPVLPLTSAVHGPRSLTSTNLKKQLKEAETMY